MDEVVLHALHTDRVVDITTMGRKTGEPRRVEIALISLGDGFVLSGSPGWTRSWYANLRANPDFIIHLKQGVQADLLARATAVLDQAERRALILRMAERDPRRRAIDVDAWVEGSPLVEVEVLAQGAP